MNKETRNRALVLLLLVGISFMLACGQTPTTGGGRNSEVAAAAPAGDVLGGPCTTAYATSNTNSDLVCSVDCGMTWRSLSNPGVCYNNQTSGGGSSPPAPVVEIPRPEPSESTSPHQPSKTAPPISPSLGQHVAEVARSHVGKKGRDAPGRGDHSFNWCSDFVSAVLKEAGVPFTGGLEGGWMLDHHTWIEAYLKAQGLWFTDFSKIQPGDIVLFSWGHSAIAAEVNRGSITTVEGSVDDEVIEREWDISDKDLRAFGRPTQSPIVMSVPKPEQAVKVGGEDVPVTEVAPGVYEFYVTITDPNDPNSVTTSTEPPGTGKAPQTGNGLCSEFNELCRLYDVTPPNAGAFYHPDQGECCCTEHASFVGKSGDPDDYSCPAATCGREGQCDSECWSTCAKQDKKNGGYLENGTCICWTFKNQLSGSATWGED